MLKSEVGLCVTLRRCDPDCYFRLQTSDFELRPSYGYRISTSLRSTPPLVDPIDTVAVPAPLTVHVTLFVSPGFSQSRSIDGRCAGRPSGTAASDWPDPSWIAHVSGRTMATRLAMSRA